MKVVIAGSRTINPSIESIEDALKIFKLLKLCQAEHMELTAWENSLPTNIVFL